MSFFLFSVCLFCLSVLLLIEAGRLARRATQTIDALLAEAPGEVDLATDDICYAQRPLAPDAVALAAGAEGRGGGWQIIERSAGGERRAVEAGATEGSGGRQIHYGLNEGTAKKA